MSCILSQLLSTSRNEMNLILIFTIISTILSAVTGFCVSQERDHVLLHAGDQVNDEIYNFSIHRNSNDNCEELLWINFLMEWKWKYNESSYDALTMEIKTFQSAFSSYINALFQKFRKHPIDLMLESINVKINEDPAGYTGIETFFKCKSTLSIISKFLEQDCDDMIRIILGHFRIKQLFLYFQDESVSADVYYDYFESEAINNEENIVKNKQTDKIYDDIKLDVSTEKELTEKPLQAQHIRMLQDRLEEIYDNVKDDETSDHIKRDFYIKQIIKLENDEFSYRIFAEVSCPLLGPKNHIDHKSDCYKKALKHFAKYAELLYAANPLVSGTKIQCIVDEIIDSFEKIGSKFIAIPNALNVNFRFKPIEFEIGSEQVNLRSGNVFDKIFENFDSSVLFNGFNGKTLVDGDRYIDEKIVVTKKEEPRNQEDDFENSQINPTSATVTPTTTSRPSSHHQQNLPKNEVKMNIQKVPLHNLRQLFTDVIFHDANEPFLVIEGAKMKIINQIGFYYFEKCAISVYPNLEIKIYRINDEENDGEEEDKEIDYSEYDYSSLEKLSTDPNPPIDSQNSEESSELQSFFNSSSLFEAIQSLPQKNATVDPPENKASTVIIKKFDPKDPLWKSIIRATKLSENRDIFDFKDVDFLLPEDTMSEVSDADKEQTKINKFRELFKLYETEKAVETLAVNDNYVQDNCACPLGICMICIVLAVLVILV